MAFVGRSDVKDPGSQQDQWDRLARRRERLYAEGAQFQSAVEHSGRAIPHVSQQLIEKYLADLAQIGVLTR